MAGKIFLVARLLSDKHYRCPICSLSEDRLRGVLPQIASPALGRGSCRSFDRGLRNRAKNRGGTFVLDRKHWFRLRHSLSVRTPSGCALPKANQHLGIAFDALIELVVGFGSIIDLDMMAHNPDGFSPAAHDQIAEIFVVLLNRSLTATHGDSLIEIFSDRKRVDAILRVFIFCSRIGSDVDPDNPHAAGWIYQTDAIFQHLRRLLFLGIAIASRLVTYSVDHAVHALHLFLAWSQ